MISGFGKQVAHQSKITQPHQKREANIQYLRNIFEFHLTLKGEFKNEGAHALWHQRQTLAISVTKTRHPEAHRASGWGHRCSDQLFRADNCKVDKPAFWVADNAATWVVVIACKSSVVMALSCAEVKADSWVVVKATA